MVYKPGFKSRGYGKGWDSEMPSLYSVLWNWTKIKSELISQKKLIYQMKGLGHLRVNMIFVTLENL